jgi:2,3-bisphosphoglycerate-dependent phosphoglycerate mutase
MTVLYLVRHAHTNWTPDENRPLSTTGLDDAHRVAHVLASFPITLILSSPYLRAIQTIEPFAKASNLKILEDLRFRERELGDIGTASFKEAVYQTWIDVDFAHPKGESVRQAQSRALEGLVENLHLSIPSHIVICTHGNLLTCILNHFDPDVSFQFWQNMSMPDVYYLDMDQTQDRKFTRIWQPHIENPSLS